MSSELEAEDVRIGDTIRVEYPDGNEYGVIAIERTVQTFGKDGV